jgi:hypothetical protein
VSRLRLLGAALLGAVLLGFAVRSLVPDLGSGLPYDLAGTGPDGLAGLATVLEELDVEVREQLDPPDTTTERVLVPVDLLDGPRRDALLSWVERGGTMVVTDPSSPLTGLQPGASRTADALGATDHAPGCDLSALDEVDRVRHSGWTGVAATAEPDPVTSAVTCFPIGDDAAWLHVVPRGAGTVVALGSPAAFVNAHLAEADNAVLAVALLGPAAGDRLTVIPRPPPEEEPETLASLIPDRVVDGLALLVAACLVALVWRSRRLGRPVPDHLPPVVPSAELARAVGDLLQRAGSREGAADRLRGETRRLAGRTLGVPATTDAEQLTALAAGRLGVPKDVATAALVDGPVHDDHELTRIAQAVAEVRAAATAPGLDRPPADPGTQEPRP